MWRARNALTRAVMQMRQSNKAGDSPKQFLDLQIAMRGDRIDGAGDALSMELFVQADYCRLARHPLAIPLAMATSAYSDYTAK